MEIIEDSENNFQIQMLRTINGNKNEESKAGFRETAAGGHEMESVRDPGTERWDGRS